MKSLIIVEIGDDIAVSFAGRLLSALGARVICVEPPTGHQLRQIDGGWAALGAGKESVVLDLQAPRRRRWLGSLAQRCNVIIEGPGRHDAAAVRTYVKRRLVLGGGNHVFASITPFGLSGPKSGWPSTSFVDYHAGGDAFFLPPGPAMDSRAPVAGGDLSGEGEVGWSVAGTVLAFALRAQQLNPGSGYVTHLDISKQEVLLDLNRVELSRFANNGTRESRLTKGYETGGLFYTRDQPIVIMPLEDHQWQKLFSLMAHPAWTRNGAFATRTERADRSAELQQHLQEWCAQLSAEDLYHQCQRAGVPVGVVRGPLDVFRSQQMRQRGFFQPVVDEDGSRVEIPWLPLPAQVNPNARVPRLGEHSISVLAGELELYDSADAGSASP